MFENRFGQDPVTAAGPSLAGEQPITRQLRRRRLRTINLLSAAMLATGPRVRIRDIEEPFQSQECVGETDRSPPLGDTVGDGAIGR